MKSLLFISSLVFSNFAFANIQAQWTTKTATIFYASTKAYYSCDYAEAQTLKALQTLGARSIKVRCSGGLPDFESVHIKAQFTSASYADKALNQPIETASWSLTSLAGKESCEFNEQVAKSLLPYFTVSKMANNSSCWGAQGRYNIEVDVLK